MNLRGQLQSEIMNIQNQIDYHSREFFITGITLHFFEYRRLVDDIIKIKQKIKLQEAANLNHLQAAQQTLLKEKQNDIL